MHCHLRPPDDMPSPFPRWLRRHAKFEVAEPIHCRIIAFLLKHYFTLWLWPLTVNTCICIACDVIKLCTKFERNRATRGGVIAISVFHLMTLNMCVRVALGPFQQVWASTMYSCLNYSVFMLIRWKFYRTVLRGAWTQLHHIWRGHKAIIDADQVVSEFTYLAAGRLKVEWRWKRR